MSYDWSKYSASSDSKTLNSTNQPTLKELREALIRPLGESINEAIEEHVSTAMAKIITGNNNADSALSNSLNNQLKVNESSLENILKNNEISLEARIKKTTEIITGILVGIYDEDIIEDTLKSIDINNLTSINDNWDGLEKGASFMKNDIKRNSNFTMDNGTEHNPVDPLIELTRAVKSLVVQHTWMSVKSDKQASNMGVAVDGVVSEAFYNDAKAANRKVAEDTVHQILNLDGTHDDDGIYPNNQGFE